MRLIDLDEAIETVTQIVNEKPEGFTYQSTTEWKSCAYVPIKEAIKAGFEYGADSASEDDVRLTTGCLVGEMLNRLDFPMEKIAGCNSGVNGFNFKLALDSADYEITHAAQVFLSSVQAQQDDGNTWKEALDYGLEKVGRTL